MVNDEGNGSDGPYTHRSLMKEDDVGSMENRIAVFSSPQNRRTSSARKLKTKTLSGSSAPMGVPRDSGTLGDGGGVVGGGGEITLLVLLVVLVSMVLLLGPFQGKLSRPDHPEPLVSLPMLVLWVLLVVVLVMPRLSRGMHSLLLLHASPKQIY